MPIKVHNPSSVCCYQIKATGVVWVPLEPYTFEYPSHTFCAGYFIVFLPQRLQEQQENTTRDTELRMDLPWWSDEGVITTCLQPVLFLCNYKLISVAAADCCVAFSSYLDHKIAPRPFPAGLNPSPIHQGADLPGTLPCIHLCSYACISMCLRQGGLKVCVCTCTISLHMDRPQPTLLQTYNNNALMCVR